MLRKSMLQLSVQKQLLLTGMILGSLTLPVAAQQWNLVGGAPLTTANGSYSNLVQDNAGNYYVSYYAGGVAQGSVQKYNGTSWSFLGGQGVSPGFATYNALGVNASGEVYYSFQDGANSSYMSVKKFSPVTNAWTDAGVAISGAVVNYQNLKIIPSTNYPVVTYNASGMRAKKYNGSTWTDVGASPIVTGNQVNHAMVVGSNDTVYVAVQIGTAYSVYKNHINAGSTDAWQLVGNSSFTSGGSANQFTVSLAIDGSNNLYMAYRALSADASKIAVYKYSAGNWTTLGNQLFSANAVEHISIAVTPAGIPTVAFRENNPTDKTLVYTLSGNTWVSLGAASATLGNYNSLILDNGTPVVAFCESTGVNGGLVTVKKYSPGTPVDSVVVATQNNVAASISTNAGILQATATVHPSSVNQNVTWSVVPLSGMATISTAGLVTAQANGTVYAKAVSVADPTKMDSMLINITNQTVNVTSLTVSTQNNVPAVISANAGTLQAIATIMPVNATNQNVSWSIVPGTGTATISATGLVTAQTNGTVYAKAVSAANNSIKDSIEINISNQLINPTGLQVSVAQNAPAAITTLAGTIQMVTTFAPANTSNQDVSWSIVPGTGTATISATGLVTAQTNGTVYARAISVVNVALKDSVEISISNQSTNSVQEQMAQLGLNIYPNPVQQELIIDLARTGIVLEVSLTDVLGNMVYKGVLNNTPLRILVQHISAGTYLLHISGDGVQLHHKIIKH